MIQLQYYQPYKCFCVVRSSSVSVFAVRSGVSVFVLSARRPGAQPRVKEVWSAAGHFYTATSLYCHHHHHHSVIHIYFSSQRYFKTFSVSGHRLDNTSQIPQPTCFWKSDGDPVQEEGAASYQLIKATWLHLLFVFSIQSNLLGMRAAIFVLSTEQYLLPLPLPLIQVMRHSHQPSCTTNTYKYYFMLFKYNFQARLSRQYSEVSTVWYQKLKIIV